MESEQQEQLVTYKRKNRPVPSKTAAHDAGHNTEPHYVKLYQAQTQGAEGNAAASDDVPNMYKSSKKKQKRRQGVKKKSIQSNPADSENDMANHQGLSIIKTKSWSGILRHRMAVKGLKYLVERLDYKQWLAIMEIGFGGFLAVRTSCIPKQLARWLLEHFDPWDNSLKLGNNKVLEITEEDVHASLGLPMGPQEVVEARQLDDDIQYTQLLENWRARWNVKSGGPPIGTMDQIILERREHGAEFKRDFVVYAISTCIMGNANGTCHFRILKSLLDVDRIHNYNWCAYVIKCLSETVVDWQADHTKYFTGPLLFLMLCYLDRVEFRGKRMDRWFPTAINWTTEDVKQREKDERLLRKYGTGRIIQRLDYENIMHIAEMDLQQEFEIRAPVQHGELQINRNFGTTSISPTQHEYWKRDIQPPNPACNEPIQVHMGWLNALFANLIEAIAVTGQRFTLGEILSHIARAESKRSISSAYKPISDSIEKNCDDDILSEDDDMFRDPKFLETLSHVESEAIEYFHKKKSMGVTPPSVKLPLSPKKAACLSPTLHFTPPSFSLGFSPKKGEAASPHEQVASNGREHPKSLKESNKENMSPNVMGKLTLQHNNDNQFYQNTACKKTRGEILRVTRDPPQDKDKMVATRQQPKRIIKELPYVCRSPFLKDYKEARERLNSDELVVVDYVFLPADEQHRVTEVRIGSHYLNMILGKTTTSCGSTDKVSKL